MKALTAPQSVRVETTAAGRALVAVATAGALGGWLLGGTWGLLGAALLADLALGFGLTWRELNRLALAIERDAVTTQGRGFTASLTVANTGGRALRDVSFHLGDRPAARLRPNGFLSTLLGGARSDVPLTLRLAERGRHRILTLEAVSSFPFGLFACRARYALPVDVLVLPRRGRLAGLAALDPSPKERVPGSSTSRVGDEEPDGIRAWREGESLRRVHWRLSARRQSWVLRDYRPEALPRMRVLLTCSVHEHGPWLRRDPSFERAVGLAATLVEHGLREGRTVELGIPSLPGEPEAFSANWTRHRGRAGLHTALVRLAEAEARPGDPWFALKRALFADRTRRTDDTSTWAVIAGGGIEDSGPPDTRVLDVDDPGTTRVFHATDAAARARKIS